MKLVQIDYVNNNTFDFYINYKSFNPDNIYIKSIFRTPKIIDEYILDEAISIKFKSSIIFDSKKRRLIKITLNDIVDNPSFESSIVIIYLGLNNKKYYIEIIRQGSQFLKNKFNFNKNHGYCIYGRNNIALKDGLRISHSKRIIYFRKSTIKELAPAPKLTREFPLSCDNEIKKISKVLNTLISFDLCTGPCNSSYEYDFARFTKKIDLLKNSKHSVQCSGFRDIFVAVIASMGFKVRNIDANNYEINVENLITWGHSFCEIFLNSFNKWVIFDPWYCGLMIFDLNHTPLSVREVLNSILDEKSDELKTISILDSWNRRLIDSNSSSYYFNYQSTKLSLKSCYSDSNCLNLAPGYLEYFQKIRITDIKINTLAVLFRKLMIIFQVTKKYLS